MQEQLIKKAIEYLSSIEAFAGKEVPAFIQELLEFKIMEHLIHAIGSSVGGGLLLSAIVGLFCIPLFHDCGDFDNKARKLLIKGTLFSSIIIIPFMFVMSNNTLQAYKAYKAPRVYLVDYFKSQTK